MPEDDASPKSPYAKPGPYTTSLSSADEKSFGEWVKTNKIPWRESPTSDYDMRGFWKAQQSGNQLAKRSTTNQHFPDIWKTPYHKSFSNESMYATPGAPHWEGDKLVPTAAPQASSSGDQFDYAKLPDGSYAKFKHGTSPDQMRSALESKGLLKPKTQPKVETNQFSGDPTATRSSMLGGVEGKAKEMYEGVKSGIVKALPAAGATVGAMAGGAPGAALGGAAGEAAKQLTETYGTKTEAPKTGLSGAKDIATSGVLYGAQEYALGTLLPKGLSKIGQKALPKTFEAVNKYLGLAKSDLPKWERFNLQSVHDIGKTVLEKVGLKGTLEAQKDAIEATRATYNQATENLIKNTVGSKLSPAHGIIDGVGTKLTRELELMGRTPEQLAAVQKNVDALKAAYPKANATPEELLNLRREIQKDIKWTNIDPADVRQKFLQEMYFETNSAIKNALPKAQATQFSAFNKVQHNLIVARDAAERKLTDPAYKKGVGVASKLATRATGAAIGAAVGGAAGSEFGHAKEGAIGGALLGGVGFHGREIRPDVHAPVADVRVQQALAKVAPKLANMAKHSATAARALEAIKSIQGGDTSHP